jgi:hypothetical protein
MDFIGAEQPSPSGARAGGKARRFVSALAALGASCSAVAAQAPSADPAPGRCSAERARSLIGEAYTEETAERARRAAGATTTRLIEPGGAATMDLRGDRLNLHVDSSGIIREARCG